MMNNIQNILTLMQTMADEGRNDELLPIAKTLIQDIENEGGDNRDFIVSTEDYYKNLGKRSRGEIRAKIIPTGFKDIDNRLYGVFAGEIMTIAARTGVGKTTLGIDMALNMLEERKVGFITLEMTKEDMLDRMMSRECNIYLGSFYSDSFSQRDIENLKSYGAKAKEKIDKLMLAYGCFNLNDILSTIKHMADNGCEVVFIDWLGMINAPGNKRNEQMHDVMVSLKDIAIEKDIAIVAMQQLNRQIDNIIRDDPQLSDIADSSAIEHISSPVLILWKDKNMPSDETFCTIFKARRINEDAKQVCKDIANAQGMKRQQVFYKITFKDDLGHCSFRDFDYHLPSNQYEEGEKMPF